MKILNYKNRIQAAFEILFKPSSFWFRLKSEQDAKIKASNESLTEDFEQRIRFLFNEKRKALQVSLLHESPPILAVPVVSSKNRTQGMNYFEEANYNLESLFFGISEPQSTVHNMKYEASKALASKMIDEGIIQSRMTGNKIEFFINYF